MTERLVPIPVYEFIDGSKHAFDASNPGHNAKRILVEATPGTGVELVEAISPGSLEKLLLIEAKQGDRFIWPQGVMDAGLLYKMPFEDVNIRDNEPLELYLNTVYSTPAGGGETFSCCFMGKQTVLDEDRFRESKRLQAKASHFVHEDEFERWLPDTERGELMASVVRQFIRGEEPDLTTIRLDPVTERQAVQMSSPMWLKLLQAHLRKAPDSFVKQVLFAAQTEGKRRTPAPTSPGPMSGAGKKILKARVKQRMQQQSQVSKLKKGRRP